MNQFTISHIRIRSELVRPDIANTFDFSDIGYLYYVQERPGSQWHEAMAVEWIFLAAKSGPAPRKAPLPLRKSSAAIAEYNGEPVSRHSY